MLKILTISSIIIGVLIGGSYLANKKEAQASATKINLEQISLIQPNSNSPSNNAINDDYLTVRQEDREQKSEKVNANIKQLNANVDLRNKQTQTSIEIAKNLIKKIDEETIDYNSPYVLKKLDDFNNEVTEKKKKSDKLRAELSEAINKGEPYKQEMARISLIPSFREDAKLSELYEEVHSKLLAYCKIIITKQVQLILLKIELFRLENDARLFRLKVGREIYLDDISFISEDKQMLSLMLDGVKNEISTYKLTLLDLVKESDKAESTNTIKELQAKTYDINKKINNITKREFDIKVNIFCIEKNKTHLLVK